MAHKRKWFAWCPQPQTPIFGVLRQYSKPILSLVTGGVIIVALVMASGLAFSPSLSPIPFLHASPTPTMTPDPVASATPTPQSAIKPQTTGYPSVPQPSAPSPSPTPIPTWHTETVGKSEWILTYPSLALDSNGNPHISWGNIENCLMYASRNGTGWHIQTVDKSTFEDLGNASLIAVGRYSSLAIDSKGYPHISYSNYTRFGMNSYLSDLKYAWWNGTAWNIQKVDSGKAGECCSLVLDSNDRPHICYFQFGDSKGKLIYATQTGTNWTFETVDSVYDDNDGTYDTSIALDSAGRPHICYLPLRHSNLKYAVRTSTGWTTQVVEPNGVDNSRPSIALDSTDRPHISYACQNPRGPHGAMNCNIKYARWDGTGWNTQIIEADWASNSALVLDSKDNPLISFDADGEVYYAEWDGATWNVILMRSGAAGPMLALDSFGQLHMSYATGEGVKYAYSS